MKAVMFGAGNIGRGFIAELLTEAGLEVVFIDVNNKLIEAINRQGCYRQVIVGLDVTEKQISNVRAVDALNTQRVSDELSDCILIGISVGAGFISAVTPAIANGLANRWEHGNHTPVNILICENLNNADEYIKKEILLHLPDKHHVMFNESVGLLETSIGRMIPVVPEDVAKEDPAVVYVEPYKSLPYDSAAVKGIMPHIPATVPYSPFEYYKERKLFLHNMGHFVCALLGRLLGYTYVWEAVSNPAVAFFVRSAMSYAALALSKKHAADYGDLLEHVDDLLFRFSNKALGDTIERVARDISRKLAKDDRLYGAIKLCDEQNVPSEHIWLGIAVAHLFSPDTQVENEFALKLIGILETGFDFTKIQLAINQHKFTGEKNLV